MRSFGTLCKNPCAWLAVVAACAIGCSPGDTTDSGEGNDTSRHDNEIVPTAEGNLSLLTPYNYVFDLAGTGDPCVQWSGAPRVQVTALTTDVSINYVASLSQLQEQLGVDAAIGIKADPIGGGQITSNYVHSTSSTNSSYSYLLRVAQHYDVLAAAPVKMAKQPTDPEVFLRSCGESYAKGLTYGAVLHVLMTVEAPTQSQADSIAVGVTANAGQKLSVANVSGNVSTNVNKSSKATSSQFKVAFTLEAKGFDPRDGQGGSLTLPTSADGTLVPDTMNALSAYLDKLAASVKVDRTTDATATGLNSARNAVATNVHRGFYTLTDGFDAAHNPFDVLNKRLNLARDFISKVGYLQEQLNDVYYGEINAFLNADESKKAKYNVAPPGKPLPNVSSVAALVQDQEATFRPAGGSGVLNGNVTSGLRKLSFACLTALKNVEAGATTLAPCTIKAAEQPEYQTALDALDKYAATARVLPLHYFSAGDKFFDSCDKTSSSLGTPLALADQVQVMDLAPAVAADPEGCAWYNDTTGKACASLSTGYFTSSTTESPADIAKGYQCGSDLNVIRKCAVLCVPPSGVFAVPTLVGRGRPLPKL